MERSARDLDDAVTRSEQALVLGCLDEPQGLSYSGVVQGLDGEDARNVAAAVNGRLGEVADEEAVSGSVRRNLNSDVGCVSSLVERVHKGRDCVDVDRLQSHIEGLPTTCRDPQVSSTRGALGSKPRDHVVGVDHSQRDLSASPVDQIKVSAQPHR